jgi:hypothetical protein
MLGAFQDVGRCDVSEIQSVFRRDTLDLCRDCNSTARPRSQYFYKLGCLPSPLRGFGGTDFA